VFGQSVNRRRSRLLVALARVAGLVASLAAASCPAAAAEQSGAPATLTVRARSAPDGATLLLEDGREVRLVGLLVPPAGLRFANERADRVGAGAAQALARLAVGKKLTLDTIGRRPDRYGRQPAEIFDAKGRLLQAMLLAQGWARFDPGLEPPPHSGEMYTAERTARDHHRGLWADALFRVRRPDDLGRALDDFAIVGGMVASVERAGARTLVRFGPEPRRSVTLTIDAAARARFRALGYDPATLVGQEIRVRGWVERQGAPIDGMVIAIQQPLQIERLAGIEEMAR
jgi:endonuclease YncB( thermonuclease family)